MYVINVTYVTSYEVFVNEKQLLPEVCSRVCFCQNIWCMRHTVCFQECNFLWCKQTKLFKYSVNSAVLFSKAFWTGFTRLTSWHILCCTWCPRGSSSLLKMLVPPRKGIPSLENGSIDSFINFGTPSFIYLFFFNPLSFTIYPKRLELQVPPNWDFGGWIALWCETHIFRRCRHRQTDLVTTGPFQ